MKPLVVIGALLLVARSLVLPQAIGQKKDEKGADEKAIRKLEENWGKAVENNDAKELDRIVAADFTFTLPDGRVLTRKQYVSREEIPADEKVEKADNQTDQVRVIGDVAVVNGHSTLTGKKGGEAFEYRFRWTDVFVKRDGRWQAVSAQLTPINAEWWVPFVKK
jgi:uncharacterized protein (TIGR02246 family)